MGGDRGQGLGVPGPKPVGRTERRQAAGLLIGRRWLIAESRKTGVPIVTRRDVTAALREQRRATLPRPVDYRKFLRESGQTSRDVRMRVALDLQAGRLGAHATAGIEDPEAQQVALDTFVAGFRRKWLARTVCLAPWDDESSCGRIVRRR